MTRRTCIGMPKIQIDCSYHFQSLAHSVPAHQILFPLSSSCHLNDSVSFSPTFSYHAEHALEKSQEVMQDHLTRIAEHALCVVQVTVESKNMAIMVQELLECVMLLIGSEWLHAFIHSFSV